MNRSTWGSLRKLGTAFKHYCEVAHVEPTNENFARWLSDPDFAADRLGWSLTQTGEAPKTAEPK